MNLSALIDLVTQLDKPNTIGVSLPRAATASEALISSFSINIYKLAFAAELEETR